VERFGQHTLSPTNLRSKLISNLGDYGKKASMNRACKNKGRAEMPLPLKVVLVVGRLTFSGTIYPTS
jgi:hypothetical protein